MKMKAVSVIVVFAAVMLAACSGGDAVGKVGSQSISKEQFGAFLKLKNIPPDDKKRVDTTLDRYLERAALAQAVEKTGALDAAELQVELQEFKKQMLIGRYFEKYLRDAVSDDAIRNYYSSHADKYQSKKVHVAHILFRVDPKMDESERKAILTTAHEAYSKLKAGEAFADVAKAYSQDKVSAAKGGDLGWISEGAVAPRFSEQVFSLNEGDISEPFLTPFGFHIVKVIEAPKVVKKSLEAVKGDIRYQLRAEAKAAEIKRLLGTVTYSKEK